MKQSASSPSAGRAGKKRRGTSPAKALAAAELDALHDSGKSLSAHLDFTQARRPGREVQRVNVDFPLEMLRVIDQEAKRIGVTRQALIKLRLADTLDKG